MEQNEKLRQLIDSRFKGNAADFARKFGLNNRQVADQWLKNGIPAKRIPAVAKFFGVDEDSLRDPNKVLIPRLTDKERRKLYREAVYALEKYFASDDLPRPSPEKYAYMAVALADTAFLTGAVNSSQIAELAEYLDTAKPPSLPRR